MLARLAPGAKRSRESNRRVHVLPSSSTRTAPWYTALRTLRVCTVLTRSSCAQAAKAAADAERPHAPKKATLAEDEDDLDPNAYFENRAAAVQRAKDAGQNPYPHKFAVDYSIPDFIDHFGPTVEPGSHMDDVVSIAGRIQTKRASGAKLLFYDIVGGGQKVQIMADQRVSEHAENDDQFATLHSGVKRGDIVGIQGKPGASKKGELSIFPVHMEVRQLLAR